MRVERAERARVLGQDQVVRFSTDLAYSVTRTETFWPYFLGRDALQRFQLGVTPSALPAFAADYRSPLWGWTRRSA